MSDQILHSINGTNGRSRQPMQSSQSVWMSHWMRASCNVTAKTLNCLSDASGNEELNYVTKDDNLRRGLAVSRSDKGLGAIESRTPEKMNHGLKMHDESSRNEVFCSSIFKNCEDTDNVRAPSPVKNHNFEHDEAVDLKREMQFPSVLHGVLTANETSKNPPDSSAEYSCFAAAKPLQKKYVESSSHNVPYKLDVEKYKFDKGKAEASSSIHRSATASNKQLLNAKVRVMEHEGVNEHSQSADLVCLRKKDSHSVNEHSQSADLVCLRKKDSHSQSDNSMNKCFREGNTSFLLDVPSTSENHSPTFSPEWFQMMQKRSGLRMYPSQYISSEKTEAKKSFYDCYSRHGFPNCVHDVETTRICTTLDSVEGIPVGCSRFSQTSHRLLITKKTDFNLSNEYDIFNTTRVITKMNGNIHGDRHSPIPFYSQGTKGVILQPLSSSTDSEEKVNVGEVKTSKVTVNNESSAETDTMDMDFFKEKNLQSGANSTPSDKGFDMDSNLSLRIDVVSSREVESRWPNTKVPDINLEIPALPAASRSSQNSGPSSSKTQSLEMDVLMAHAELPKPKSNLYLDDSPKADPSNRWVKRLKLSSSHSSSQGTKSSNLAENSSNEKMNKFFSRILRSGITGSEPTQGKHHDKQSMASDESGNLSKENEEFMVDSTKKGKELLLSHAWIQRWLHKGTRISQKKPGMMVVCEPQSSKLALEDLQKNQFPSIGAMALVGKAMKGFQPCDFQKRGTFTVWNTKAV